MPAWLNIQAHPGPFSFLTLALPCPPQSWVQLLLTPQVFVSSLGLSLLPRPMVPAASLRWVALGPFRLSFCVLSLPPAPPASPPSGFSSELSCSHGLCWTFPVSPVAHPSCQQVLSLLPPCLGLCPLSLAGGSGFLPASPNPAACTGAFQVLCEFTSLHLRVWTSHAWEK